MNATETRPGGREDSPYREPILLRYLHLLWERRWLILGGSLLPTVLVGMLLNLWPRRYTATFVYERPLAESEYDVLLRRFYSQENLDKIMGRLRERGLTNYVQQLNQARMHQSFERLIEFEVSPMYPRRLQTTDPCTSEKISVFKARLLSVRVQGNSEAEVAGVSAIVTGNIENVLPLYDIRNQLKESAQKVRTDAAAIEDGRFKLSIDLQKEKAKLEKLKALETTPVETSQGSIVLQFTDVEKSRDYLPLSYQIRAVQSKIVELQETLTSDTEKYNFYLQVLDLEGRLLAKIEENLLTYYTAQQFLEFLGEQLLACKDQAVCDHLKSYIRKTENLVSVNTRAGEKPIVYPMSKGLVKNTVLTFLLALMVVMFVAVLLEHRRVRLRQALAEHGPGWSPGPRTPGPGPAAPDRSPG